MLKDIKKSQAASFSALSSQFPKLKSELLKKVSVKYTSDRKIKTVSKLSTTETSLWTKSTGTNTDTNNLTI